MKRRLFVTGLAALIAAPAIIRVAQLMPISVPKLIVPQRTLKQDIELLYAEADTFTWYTGYDPIGYDDSTGIFEFPEEAWVNVKVNRDPLPYWRSKED